MLLFEPDKFNDMEKMAMRTICSQQPAGIAEKLLKQFKSASLKSRKMTGVGFFTYFQVPETIEPVRPTENPFGNAEMEVGGLKYGCGFILFLKDDYIDFLECYTYVEPWPEKNRTF